MDWSRDFLNPAVVWVVIPVSVILIGGIRQILSMYFQHQERMAMLQHGIDPNSVAHADESTVDQTA